MRLRFKVQFFSHAVFSLDSAVDSAVEYIWLCGSSSFGIIIILSESLQLLFVHDMTSHYPFFHLLLHFEYDLRYGLSNNSILMPYQPRNWMRNLTGGSKQQAWLNHQMLEAWLLRKYSYCREWKNHPKYIGWKFRKCRHAGYSYSGRCAAFAFANIDPASMWVDCFYFQNIC